MAVNQTTTSKEKILKKVRQALIYKSKPKFSNIDLDSNVYDHPADVSLIETFARNFTTINGQFIMCDNKFDFIDKLLTLQERKKFKKIHCWEEDLQNQFKDAGFVFHSQSELIDKAHVGITTCEALIARTGSVLVSSAKNSRVLTIYPPVHIVLAYSSQVVYEVKDGLQKIKNKYGKNLPSLMTYISGPAINTTLDIKQVNYAHGPRELFVFIIDDTTP